jgi:oligo-1,6-glucosidase
MDLSNNQTWWKEAVVYQIYVRSFSDSNGDGIGDLRGVIERLDYLGDLGVDVLWLNPIYPSPNDDNGYDISDYRGIHPDFGTMEEFEELLTRVHDRGMRLIMDLVVNHTSDEHPWFREARSSRENRYRDYYIWREPKDGGPPNNWRSFFGGSAWERDAATGEYYLHIFSRKQPDLNWENPEVRREVREIIRFWLDKGVDGFRMDVVNLISKRDGLPDGREPGTPTGHEHFANGPRIRDYLRHIAESMEGYDVMTVGESIIANLETVAEYVDAERGFFNMAISFDHITLDHGPRGRYDSVPLDPAKLKASLAKWQEGLQERGWNCLYLSNHDHPRQVSRFGDDGRFRRESATMLATLLHTLRGTPFVMQGEEIGMTNVAFSSIDEYDDIECRNYYEEALAAGIDPRTVLERIHRQSRDNARTPMQWDATVNAGFTTGTPWIATNPNHVRINVEAQRNAPDSVLAYYRRLVELRRHHPVLVYGSFREVEPNVPALFAYVRELDDTRVLVALNLGGEPARWSPCFESASCRTLITNYSDSPSPARLVELRPYEAIVLLETMHDPQTANDP